MIRLFFSCLVAFLSLGCSDNLIYKVQDLRPEIIVYPENIDFGSLVSGQESAIEELIIINSGDEDLSVLSPFLFNLDENYSLTGPGAEFIIKPGELVVVEVY